MKNQVAKIAFYFVAIVLIVWTSTLTYSFVASVLPAANWFVPLFALVVFDAGMIAWLVVFIDHAAGNSQRAIAILSCVFDLIGVGLMAFAEILLGGQTLATVPANMGEYAIWGIGVWTVVNVAAVVAFHLTDPDARKRMALQGEKDAIFNEALEKLKTKRAQQSGVLSDQIANGMMEQMKAELAVDHNNDGVPDIMQTPKQTAVIRPINGVTPQRMAADTPPLPTVTKPRNELTHEDIHNMSMDEKLELLRTMPDEEVQEKSAAFFGWLNEMMTGKEEQPPSPLP